METKTSYEWYMERLNKKLIIKSHPRDDVKWILNYISDSEVKNVILDKNTPTEELLPYCEALITTNSTLMLDAMILKKPVINLNLIICTISANSLYKTIIK